ncbi:uncharacterized protein N7459_003581 [Penicillium hispanicum]|uniref:uncharacterized protein n=1 Tax=Penicillium hispanicum TaxID=1080232 RepID=UPI0025424F94|nr:uncharacterized protein N7459_003581 [Penicillium hispanicum]KAJ5587816.1 hypothetical protein N7459_003581 [Penicillium hispanicum]
MRFSALATLATALPLAMAINSYSGYADHCSNCRIDPGLPKPMLKCDSCTYNTTMPIEGCPKQSNGEYECTISSSGGNIGPNMDLNACFINHDNEVKYQFKGGFGASCQEISLDGSTMKVTCNGVKSEVDLNKYVGSYLGLSCW